MAHTQTPWKIKRGNGTRNSLHIVSGKPMFEGGSLLVRIATMHKLKGFAGSTRANAELIVTAVNAWDSIPALETRINELFTKRAT